MHDRDESPGEPRTVLVTGAGGYIGRHVVRALLDRGASVIAVDRGSGAGRVDPRATHIQADIFTETDRLLGELPPVDVCLHLAWEAGFVHGDPLHMLRLSSHYAFLDAVLRRGVGHLAVLGTVHEIGYHEGAVDETTPTEPLSLYGVAKNSLRQALTIRTEKEPDAVLQWLRCYYVYGDDENNNSIFTKIVRAARNGDRTFPFTTGQNQYDFITVEELARQVAAAVLQTEERGIINCCSGTPRTLREMVERFITERGLDIALEYGVYPDRPYDSPAIWGDPTRIDRILGLAGGAPVGGVDVPTPRGVWR